MYALKVKNSKETGWEPLLLSLQCSFVYAEDNKGEVYDLSNSLPLLSFSKRLLLGFDKGTLYNM
jgi:hypothetical protein